MIDSWEMGTERNESSVLAKLMGIDKPSTPYITGRKHRALSDSYLQNIAFVAKREKTLSYSDDADLYMDVIGDSNEFSQRGRKSFLFGKSYSSSYSSSGKMKQTKPVFERSKGVNFREKRTNRSCNSMKSPIQESLSSQETAKQVTGQVMHSVWHSYAESSSSSPSTEKSSEIEDEATLTSLKKKHEASPFNSVKGSTSRETRKATKQLSEKWTRKYSLDEMLVTSSYGNCNSAFTAGVNGCSPVHAGRYLSKSVLFPSAWIPRSRARDFTLEKNWCLSQEKIDNGLEEDDCGHKYERSIPESIICSLDLQKPCIHQEVSLIFNDTLKHGAKNSGEETFTVTESLSNMSAFSSSESRAHRILNENGCRHLQKDVSHDKTVDCLLVSCNFAPLSLGSGEVADEEIKNQNKSAKVWRENLSAKEAACILLGDRESWKHQPQNKSNTSEPGSPVSSLEGPESCRHVPISTVEADEQLAVSDSENDTHVLQSKLQLTDTMSLESGSEGPSMVVSSEEGDDGALAVWNLKQIMEMNQTWTEESYEFSYIVDVVVDSGLHMRNWEKESKTWFLQGYVLESSVYGMLEKKYGKHVPWEKSERKLLFDRINSGLFEMVKPSYFGLSSWKKPVVKRLSQRQKTQELIEDEVWGLLVKQEEEAKREYELWGLLVKQEDKVKRESYDMVHKNEMELLDLFFEREWLDLEEDTSSIAQEIQSLLIDELIEEFVGMETSFC